MTFYEYKIRSSSPGWKFQKVIDGSFKNDVYIHPLKQKIVYEIIEMAKKDHAVRSLRVFGSAITNRCDFQSDLDLCVEWSFDCYDEDGVLVEATVSFLSAVSRITKGKCDIVHYNYLEGTIVEDAAKKGVIVYVSYAE